MQGLELWTIYNHPSDHPDKFVARKWINDVPTDAILIADTLEALREKLPAGLYRLSRQSGDDEVIVETWF